MGFIDVHTHITSEAYTSLLTEHGSHIYNLRPDSEGRTVVMRGNIRFMTFTEPMFDPEMRFAPMDEVGVDMQLLSYTCPNTYWAGPDIVEHLTRTMNDHLASVCNQWPDRYRGLASVPLQNVELAISEMERAVDDLEHGRVDNPRQRQREAAGLARVRAFLGGAERAQTASVAPPNCASWNRFYGHGSVWTGPFDRLHD